MMSTPVFDVVQQHLAPATGEFSLSHGTLVVKIPPAALLDVAGRLKGEFGFDLLLDVTAVDWPGGRRGSVVYHFTDDASGPVRLKRAYLKRIRPSTRWSRCLARPTSWSASVTTCTGSSAQSRPASDPAYEGFAAPLRKDYPKQQEQPLVPIGHDEADGAYHPAEPR
jgi:NADH-quinone oxidoreductase subunit C